MNPLSELVRYYNHLCSLSTVDNRNLADDHLRNIIAISHSGDLESLRLNILSGFDQFESSLDQLKKKINDQIREEERPYIEDSYKLYEEFRCYRYEWFKPPYPSDSIEVQEYNIQLHINKLLNDRLPLAEGTREVIDNRISRFSGWKNTTLILRPSNENWIQKMVSNDPIYLVDESYDLLTPTLSEFNQLYQRRLRTYVIREDEEQQDILWQLPDDQFGLVLAWNYFNTKPFEVIRRYLTELYKKMKPGGMLLLTFNDCDRWQGVKAVESKVGLYTPGSLIRSYAELLGFEQYFDYNDNGPWTWLELRKPGERESLRGGQALAQILPKPIA